MVMADMPTLGQQQQQQQHQQDSAADAAGKPGGANRQQEMEAGPSYALSSGSSSYPLLPQPTSDLYGRMLQSHPSIGQTLASDPSLLYLDSAYSTRIPNLPHLHDSDAMNLSSLADAAQQQQGGTDSRSYAGLGNSNASNMDGRFGFVSDSMYLDAGGPNGMGAILGAGGGHDSNTTLQSPGSIGSLGGPSTSVNSSAGQATPSYLRSTSPFNYAGDYSPTTNSSSILSKPSVNASNSNGQQQPPNSNAQYEQRAAQSYQPFLPLQQSHASSSTSSPDSHSIPASGADKGKEPIPGTVSGSGLNNIGSASSSSSSFFAGENEPTSSSPLVGGANSHTPDDTTQIPKTTLSRHVTSVISHFTSTRQGFHRLISELDDFLHVVSTTGTITLCSSSVRRLLGYQPDELAGRPLADLLHRDDRDNVLNALSRAVSERVEHMHYVRYQRKAGDFVLLHVRAKPLIRNGEVRSVVHTARPVRSKSSQAMDWVLDLRIENIRLRRQLEKALRERGQDPGDHPLLQQVSTKRVMITTDLEANEEEGADPADELSSRIGSAGVDGMSGGLGSEGPGLFENDSVAGIGNSNPAGSTSRGTKRKKSRIPTEELFCRQCGTTQSPEWRKGPAGPKTLCNACGLAYSKKQRKATKTSTAPTGPTAAAKENDP